MNTRISVALFAFVCFFQKGACTITGWRNPLIASGDGGYGSSTSYVDNGTTVGVTTVTIIAISDDSSGVTAYTIVSQDPSNVVLNIANSGLISIESGVADFATTPVYQLVIANRKNKGTKFKIALFSDNGPTVVRRTPEIARSHIENESRNGQHAIARAALQQVKDLESPLLRLQPNAGVEPVPQEGKRDNVAAEWSEASDIEPKDDDPASDVTLEPRTCGC